MLQISGGYSVCQQPLFHRKFMSSKNIFTDIINAKSKISKCHREKNANDETLLLATVAWEVGIYACLQNVGVFSHFGFKLKCNLPYFHAARKCVPVSPARIEWCMSNWWCFLCRQTSLAHPISLAPALKRFSKTIK